MKKALPWLIGGILLILCAIFFDCCQTVVDQFGPSALLKKYEWFKDASASLDAKSATINDYEVKFSEMKLSYGKDSVIRAKWNAEDREQWNLWVSELSGYKGVYNDLAAQYNAQMAKFNWHFCNAGTLPQGAEIVLPREYRIYK